MVSRLAESLRPYDKDGSRHSQKLHRIQNGDKRRHKRGAEDFAGTLDTGLSNISEGSGRPIERLFQSKRWHDAPRLRNAVLRQAGGRKSQVYVC